MKFENFDIKTLQQGDNYQRLTESFTIKWQLSTRDIKTFNKVTIINLWQNWFLQLGDNYQPLTANLYKAKAINPWYKTLQSDSYQHSTANFATRWHYSTLGSQTFTKRQSSTTDSKPLEQSDSHQPSTADLYRGDNQWHSKP